MKKDYQMRDFWLYVAQIQEKVAQEVLDQVPEEEYFPCHRAITDYMFCLRAMHLDRIQLFNKGQNKYIPLINEALKKRGIYIYSDYINIAFC